jgi:transposase
MGKCYSLDLRERVVRFVSAGHSRREAALQFDVSPSFTVKLVARHQKTGQSRPARQGRPAGGGKLSRHRGFLIRRVREKPDITMPELARELEAALGVKASPASLSRFLCKAGFTFKKNAAGLRAGARRCQTGASGLDIPPSSPDAP